MLHGTIKYEGHTYEAHGVDSSSALNLRLSSNNMDSILLMSGAPEQGDELWERGVTIGLSNVTVETNIREGENGKKVKSPINFDLFCRVGALIRYVKSHCYARNSVGYMGMALASGEYDPEVVTAYRVDVGGYPAEAELRLGNLYSLKLSVPGVEVDLKDNPDGDLEVMPTFKNGVRKGIAFSEEYLGVPVQLSEHKNVGKVTGVYTTLAEVIEAHPEKELEWLRNQDYHIVTQDELEGVCEYLWGYDGKLYFDTETTGLNINFRSRIGQADQCVGIILSAKEDESFFFPMQMKHIENLCGGDHFYFMERYIRRLLEQKKIVCHNMAFDWKVAYIYDINANIVDDTQILYKLTLGAEHPDLGVGLKKLTEQFIHRDSLELDDLVAGNEWGETDVKFWDLSGELVKYYACADTDNTRAIERYAYQADLLTKYNAHKVYEIEIAFAFAVAYQEFYGHMFDVDKVGELRAEVEANLVRLKQEMAEMVGHDFNPNSAPQMIQILYHELGYPEQTSRKTDRPTANAKALEFLSKIEDLEGNPKYPFVNLLLEFRENEGVRKIIDKFPELATKDGYLFPEVRQLGTTTGRVSITSPNYQSYSDPVKKDIKPRPGYYGFDTDYSSVEYRVLGNMAGNEAIKSAFYDPDFDYHTYQAARMHNVPYSAVTKELRQSAKGVNFGLPYGMGDQSLGAAIFGEVSEQNTQKAALLRKKYFQGQEDIRLFFETARNDGVMNNFTETYFGRRRYYDRKRFSVGSIKRQAGNQRIQGSAADIYKIAVGNVFKRICREGWLGKVLFDGFIHDELFGEVSLDIDPCIFLRVLREEFEVKISEPDGTPWCPLYMGFGWGRSWYEAKKTELPIKLQWELVEKYGEKGYPDWTGDIDAFCDSIPHMIRDFSIRDTANQLLSPEAQGKEIKPALNKEMMKIVEADISLAKSGKPDELMAYDGVEELPKETQGYIDLFCKYHGVDRSKIDVRNIESVKGGLAAESVVQQEEKRDEQQAWQAMVTSRVRAFGLFCDTAHKGVYLRALPSKGFMDLVKGQCVPYAEDVGYRVYLMDFESGQVHPTKSAMPTKNIAKAQQIYIDYINMTKGGSNYAGV